MKNEELRIRKYCIHNIQKEETARLFSSFLCLGLLISGIASTDLHL